MAEEDMAAEKQNHNQTRYQTSPPTVEGQVTDSGVRYEFGKKDIAQEKEEFLTQVYGPNSFVKDNRGRYLLNLDNISPEVKAQQNLPDEGGLMWFNKPGGGFLGLF